MGQKVIWATSALDDLEAAAEFIHRDSPAYGASFVTRTSQAARSLSDLPERGRRIPEIRDKAIREVYIQSYRLIYRIEKNSVSILALIHGRRDLTAAWSARERK